MLRFFYLSIISLLAILFIYRAFKPAPLPFWRDIQKEQFQKDLDNLPSFKNKIRLLYLFSGISLGAALLFILHHQII